MSSFESPKRPHKADIAEEMPRDWQQLRKEILRRVPSKIEGLNIARVQAFFENFPGLKLNEYVVFDEEDLPKLRELLLPTKMLKKDSFSESEGFQEIGRFIPAINLSFIKRRKDLEEANGALITERTFVHELAHSSSEYTKYIKTAPHERRVPRLGFAVDTGTSVRGSFLEEGFAEMMAGQYNAEYATEEQKLDVLRKTEFGVGMFSKAIITVEKGTGEYPDNSFYIPAKYLFKRPESQHEFSLFDSAPAAFGLELLREKNEELYPALLSARHDIESLRDVAKIINGIKPGLYSVLQKFKYTQDDFVRGLKYIIEEAYGGELPSF